MDLFICPPFAQAFASVPLPKYLKAYSLIYYTPIGKKGSLITIKLHQCEF